MKKVGILIVIIVAILGIIVIFLFVNKSSEEVAVEIESSTEEKTFIPRERTEEDKTIGLEGEKKFVEASNEFAFKIFKELNENEKNTFISPYGISTAFSMLYEGARDNTADEIQKTFGFTIDEEERREGYYQLYERINSSQGNYTLKTANAFWITSSPFRDSYKQILNTYYGADIRTLNGDPKTAVEEVNQWASDNTNGKIEEIVDMATIDNVILRGILTNAIYFKGDWAQKFKKENTKKDNFTLSNGNTKQVDFMNQATDFKYAENGELQSLELPYKGEELSMLLILPKEGSNINDFINTIDNKKIQELKEGMYSTKVITTIPKIKIEGDYDLIEPLKSLGISAVFKAPCGEFCSPSETSPKTSNLIGLEGNLPENEAFRNIFVGGAVQKTFLEVSEEGSEAAAITTVTLDSVGSSGPLPKIFKADRPLVLIIQDNRNDNILFLGKIEDPTA